MANDAQDPKITVFPDGAPAAPGKDPVTQALVMLAKRQASSMILRHLADLQTDVATGAALRERAGMLHTDVDNQLKQLDDTYGKGKMSALRNDMGFTEIIYKLVPDNVLRNPGNKELYGYAERPSAEEDLPHAKASKHGITFAYNADMSNALVAQTVQDFKANLPANFAPAKTQAPAAPKPAAVAQKPAAPVPPTAPPPAKFGGKALAWLKGAVSKATAQPQSVAPVATQPAATVQASAPARKTGSVMNALNSLKNVNLGFLHPHAVSDSGTVPLVDKGKSGQAR